MNKLSLLILPAMAMIASCGSGSSIDQAALDAKVNAKIKMSQEQQKTSCDAMVVQTAQMRADSIRTVKTAVITQIVKPAEVAAAVAVTKKPIAIKDPVVKNPTVKKPVVKVPVVKKNIGTSKTTESGGMRSQSDQSKAKDTKTVAGGGMRSQSDQTKAKDKKTTAGGGMRSQSDENKAKDKTTVEGGGMRSQSDQTKAK